jgi:hypothetical protein
MKVLKVFALLLVFTTDVNAGAVSAIIHPDLISRAILTDPTLTNITVGAHGTLGYAGSFASFHRTYVDAAPASIAFKSSVVVGDVSYSGVSSNWIRMDAVTNIASEFINFLFPGDAGGSISNALVAGFVVFSLTNNTGQQVNLDHIIIYGGGGSWCVCQVRPDYQSDTILALAHAATNGASTTGPVISLIPGKPYFRVLYRNPRGGDCCTKFYDPTNWSLVGESCSGMSGGGDGDNSWSAQFKVGYIGNIPQNIYIGDTYFIYDATDLDYFNIVHTVVLNGAVLNGFHTQ